MSASVVDIPSVVIKEVNVFVGGRFVLAFVLEFLVDLFLELSFDVRSEASWSELSGLGEGRDK